MYVYYIYILISLVCIFREYQNLSESQRKWNLKIALFPVFILMAFKGHEVGSDTPTYIYQFSVINNKILYLENFERIEPGYNLLQEVLSFMSTDPLYLFVLVALVACVSCYYFFRDNTQYSCISLYFFMAFGYLPFILSGLRQTLAMSICLFSFSFIRSKQIYKFLGLILLAMSFHKSALFFVPAYFIAYRKIKKKNVQTLYGGILLTFFFADKILMAADNIAGYNYGVESVASGGSFFVFVLLITYWALKRRATLIKASDLNLLHININFLSLAMWTVRLVSRTAERVSLYFMPYTMIVLAETIETMDKSKRSLYKLLFLLIASYWLIHRIEIQEDLNHYSFCF